MLMNPLDVVQNRTRITTLGELARSREDRRDRELARQDQAEMRGIQREETQLRRDSLVTQQQAAQKKLQSQEAVKSAFAKYITPDGKISDETALAGELRLIDPDVADKFETHAFDMKDKAAKAKIQENQDLITRLNLENEVFKKGKRDLNEVLERAALATPETWPDILEMADAYNVPQKELARLGLLGDFTPDKPQRAKQALIGAVKGAEMEATATTRADAAARAATDDARMAGTAAEQARHNRVMEQRPTAGGTTSPQNVEIKPNTVAFRTAQDIAYGKLTFPQIRTLLAYNRDPNFKMALYDKARELNPDFDPARYELGFKFAANPTVRNRVVAIDGLLPLIDRIKELSHKVPRGNVQAFNSLLQGSKLQFSNKNVANLDQMATLLGDEVGLALGVGQGSDLKTRLGLSTVNNKLGTDAFDSTMDQLAETLSTRRGVLVKQMGVYGDAAGDPQQNSPAATSKPPQNPKAGDTWQSPTGPTKWNGKTWGPV